MRVPVFLFAWMIVLITCHAQNTMPMSAYSESDMMQRWDSAAKKAVAATQPQPVIGRKPRKPDPLLTNNFQSKTFSGVGAGFDKKLSGQKDYLYDKKASSASKFGTRSFFGLKNPWFGKKVVQTDKASLSMKTDAAIADKQFPLESASTKEYYQAKKKANERMDPIQTGSTKVEAKQQGLMNSITQQKNLSVEQVRELLNKQ